MSGSREGPASPQAVATPDPGADTQPPGTLLVPELVGMTAHDARRVGRMSDLLVSVATHATDEALWDRVLSQVPAPGASLMPGDTITITIGTRPTVVVPDVRGGAEDEMLTRLRGAGLVPDRRVERKSDGVPEGHVLRTRPRSGARVPHGTKVTYIVAVAPVPRDKHGKRHARRQRIRRLPDGAFMSLPYDE